MRLPISSIILIVFVLSIHSSSCKPQDVLSWSEFDLQFPSDAVKQTVLERGFQPSEMTPYDFDVWRDKLFFTLEGQPKNLPISVGFVNLKDLGKTGSPKLFGYPEGDAKQFDWKNLDSKMALVRHLHVDACDRLWLLEEGGLVDKQPHLIVYDLTTDKLLRKHELPQAQHFQSLIVNATKGNCDNANAYILTRGTLEADKMAVYDFAEFSFFGTTMDLQRNKNQTLPEGCQHPDWFDVEILMEHATLLAPQTDGSRPLYFQMFLETDEYITSSKALQMKPETNTTYYYEILACRGHEYLPVSSSYFDQNAGVLFQVNSKAITCWNAAKHANKLSANTSGIYKYKGNSTRKIKVDGSGNLWILSFPRKNGNSMYTMSKVPVTEVVNGTVC